MSYDEWKLRAPEDEPGYWEGRTSECGDYYHDHQCLNCGKWESVCAACQLCDKCHRESEGAKEWIFTFGFSHVHPETGESLANCYVVIPDLNVDEARALMAERFGNQWAFQYPSRKAAGVEKWGLREILL